MSDSHSSGGIGCCMALFLIFLVLKLTGNIDWSWWWIFAPLWIPWGIVIFIVALVAAIWGLVTWFWNRSEKESE